METEQKIKKNMAAEENLPWKNSKVRATPCPASSTS